MSRPPHASRAQGLFWTTGACHIIGHRLQGGWRARDGCCGWMADHSFANAVVCHATIAHCTLVLATAGPGRTSIVSVRLEDVSARPAVVVLVEDLLACARKDRTLTARVHVMEAVGAAGTVRATPMTEGMIR